MLNLLVYKSFIKWIVCVGGLHLRLLEETLISFLNSNWFSQLLQPNILAFINIK